MDYKETINLPKTDFAMKANLPQREPEILRAWEEEGIYQRLVDRNAARPGAKKFVLHDGPPYANGDIHIGHALNKVLKDIIVKYRNLKGEAADYIPGWDCHGLPIELKVDKELGSKKREMDRPAIIEACRRSAEKWIDRQRDSFKRLGVFGAGTRPTSPWRRATRRRSSARWRAPPRRASSTAARSRSTGASPTAPRWPRRRSSTSRTARPRSTWPSTWSRRCRAPKLAGRKARLVIWTTTPWTLPANLAVAVAPRPRVRRLRPRGAVVVVAKDLLTRFLAEVAPDELVRRRARPTRTRPPPAARRGAAACRPARSSPTSTARRSRGSATATRSWTASRR